MAKSESSDDKGSATLFSLLQALTLKDFFLILAFLGIGSNEFREWFRDDPLRTREAITEQTEALSVRLDTMSATLSRHSRAISSVTDAISTNQERIEQVNDTLQYTLKVGLGNLDGYFRGRLDQIDDR